MKTLITEIFFNQLHPFLQVRRFGNFRVQEILTDVHSNEVTQTPAGPASEIKLDGTQTPAGPASEIKLDGTQTPAGPASEIKLDGTQTPAGPASEIKLDGTQTPAGPASEIKLDGHRDSHQALVVSLGTRTGSPFTRLLNWIGSKIALLKTPKPLFLSKWWGQGSLHKSPIDGNWYWDLDDIRAKNRDFERWERQRQINKILEQTDILRRKRIEEYRKLRDLPRIKSTPESEQRYRELVEERIARNRPFSETLLRWAVDKSSELVNGINRMYELFSGQFFIISTIISSFFWHCYNVIEGALFLVVFLFHLLLFAVLYIPCFQVSLVLFFLNTIRIVIKYSLNPWAYRVLVALFFFLFFFVFTEMLFHNQAVVEPFLNYIRETFFEKDFSVKNGPLFYPSIVSALSGEFSLENLVNYPSVNDCNGYIYSTSPNWYFSLKQISSILIPALASCFLFRLPLAPDLAKNNGRNRLGYTMVCYPILYLCLQTTLNSLPVGAYIKNIPETIINPFLLHLIFLLLTTLLVLGSRFFEKAQLYVWILLPCVYLSLFIFSVDMLFVKGMPPEVYECWSAPYLNELPFHIIFTTPENTFELYWGSFMVLSAVILLLTLTFVNSIFPFSPIDQGLRTRPYLSSEEEDVWSDFTRNVTIFWLFICLVLLSFLFFNLDNYWVQACQWTWADIDTASKKHFINVFGKSDSIPEHQVRIQILASLHQWSANSITLPSLLNFNFLNTFHQQIAGVAFIGFCFSILEKHMLYIFKNRLFPFYTIFVYMFCSFFFVFIPILFGMILFFSQ
jgi:hypothetical protein